MDLSIFTFLYVCVILSRATFVWASSANASALLVLITLKLWQTGLVRWRQSRHGSYSWQWSDRCCLDVNQGRRQSTVDRGRDEGEINRRYLSSGRHDSKHLTVQWVYIYSLSVEALALLVQHSWTAGVVDSDCGGKNWRKWKDEMTVWTQRIWEMSAGTEC